MLNMRRVALLVLALAWPLGCGPGRASETASTGPSTTSSTTHGGTTDAGQSVTSDSSLKTSTSATATTSTTSTSGEPTTEPDSTGASDGSGDSFIVPPDYGHGPGCPRAGGAKSCSTWSQDCDDGDKCVPYSGGCHGLSETRCTEVVRDPVALGGACLVEGELLSGFDNCEIGLICAYVDQNSLAGTCISQCKGSPDLPDCAHSPGTSCKFFDEGLLYLGGLCLPTCDPMAPTCPAGQLCQPNPSQPADFVCIQDN